MTPARGRHLLVVTFGQVSVVPVPAASPRRVPVRPLSWD